MSHRPFPWITNDIRVTISLRYSDDRVRKYPVHYEQREKDMRKEKMIRTTPILALNIEFVNLKGKLSSLTRVT